MTRDELIQAMRAQADLDEEDLADATAQMYLREAFHRTAALDRHWPTHEADWQYVFGTSGSVTIDPRTAEVSSVVADLTGKRLSVADHDLIKGATGLVGAPMFFSLWGGKLYVWPKPPPDTEITVSGYRRPNTDWLSSPGMQVDLDERLHLPMFHYAMSLVFAQLEDPEQESQYMQRWASGTRALRDDIMKAGSYRPIVLNGGLWQQEY
jgi:hypothetical protein